MLALILGMCIWPWTASFFNRDWSVVIVQKLHQYIFLPVSCVLMSIIKKKKKKQKQKQATFEFEKVIDENGIYNWLQLQSTTPKNV